MLPRETQRVIRVRIVWGEDALLLDECVDVARGFSIGTVDGVDFATSDREGVMPRTELLGFDADGTFIRVPRDGGGIEVRRLHEDEVVSFSSQGLSFSIESTAKERLPRHFARPSIGAWLCVLAAAFVIFVGARSNESAREQRIFASVDLSNPLVAELVELRRHEPREASEARPQAFAMPYSLAADESETSPEASEESEAETADPRLEEANTRLEPASTSTDSPMPASTSTTSPTSTPTRTSASTSPSTPTSTSAPPPGASAQTPSEAAAPSEPPSALGAIRSQVRALTRCYDERVALENTPSAENRAALDACLARSATARPDAIVSIEIEIENSEGQVQRAHGGRFGVAVTP